jgi:hypothetical protein
MLRLNGVLAEPLLSSMIGRGCEEARSSPGATGSSRPGCC